MKKLLQKKYLIFIIPAILLLILLIAAAPGAIYREHHYRSAMNALHEGDLTAAQDLLADIPMYRDSETILNSEIPYIKADGLMAAAESGDSTMLETKRRHNRLHASLSLSRRSLRSSRRL